AHLGGEGFGALPCGVGIHPEQLPEVAVGVGAAAAVHETVVLLGIGVGQSAGGGGAGQDGVDGGAVVMGQGYHHLGGLLRVGDGAVGEGGELLVRQQHDVDGVREDHAGGGVVIAEQRVLLG